jgi:hypothetical protein
MRLFVLALWMLMGAAQQAAVRTFEEDVAGKPPNQFVFAVGRDAAPGGWLVQREADNHVLVHLGRPGSASGFAVAISTPEQYEDVEVAVRLRANGGSQTGGILWKYVDPMNHYAVQLNLRAQELAVYRVVKGNRVRIDRDDGLELDSSGWHTLRVVTDGDALRVYLGGIPVFRERDRTFRGGGAVGLWAAGDAIVAFDDYRVVARAGRGR